MVWSGHAVGTPTARWRYRCIRTQCVGSLRRSHDGYRRRLEPGLAWGPSSRRLEAGDLVVVDFSSPTRAIIAT